MSFFTNLAPDYQLVKPHANPYKVQARDPVQAIRQVQSVVDEVHFFIEKMKVQHYLALEREREREREIWRRLSAPLVVKNRGTVQYSTPLISPTTCGDPDRVSIMKGIDIVLPKRQGIDISF